MDVHGPAPYALPPLPFRFCAVIRSAPPPAGEPLAVVSVTGHPEDGYRLVRREATGGHPRLRGWALTRDLAISEANAAQLVGGYTELAKRPGGRIAVRMIEAADAPAAAGARG